MHEIDLKKILDKDLKNNNIIICESTEYLNALLKYALLNFFCYDFQIDKIISGRKLE